MAIIVKHSKTLVAPDSGSEDKVYGSDYVSASSHIVSAASLPLTGVTFANLPASGTANGEMYFVNNLGASGTFMQWNGTRWRAFNGTAILGKLGAPVAGIANSETIELQTLIPAGAYQTNDSLRIHWTITKSGTTDTFVWNVRIGTTGTIADTLITGFGGNVLAAGNQSGIFITDIKLISATSAQRMGNGILGYSSVQASANAATVTITDASANALYVNVSGQSSGATNTVGFNDLEVHLITP